MRTLATTAVTLSLLAHAALAHAQTAQTAPPRRHPVLREYDDTTVAVADTAARPPRAMREYEDTGAPPVAPATHAAREYDPDDAATNVAQPLPAQQFTERDSLAPLEISAAPRPVPVPAPALPTPAPALPTPVVIRAAPPAPGAPVQLPPVRVAP